jgi:hypothetical protein
MINLKSTFVKCCEDSYNIKNPLNFSLIGLQEYQECVLPTWNGREIVFFCVSPS